MRHLTKWVSLAVVLVANQAHADEPASGRNADDEAAPASASPSASGSPSASASASAASKKAAGGKDTTACDRDKADECTCTSSCCGRHGRCHDPEIELSVAGVRPSITGVSVPAASTSELGVGFAGMVDSYALDGTTHGSMQFVIGGGQAGFEGMLAGVLDIGYRLDVTEKQGPFARAGFDGRIQGNDSLYYSALELPRLTAGWQFASRRTVLELGGRGGPILTGRFNPGGGERSTTGSWEFGGFASAQVEFLRFEATAMRINARKTGDHTPVDVGRGAICGVAGRLGICGDFMLLRGSANMGGPIVNMQEALASYMGLTVGVASW